MTDLLLTAAELKGASSPDSAYSRMGDDVPTDEIEAAIRYAQEAVGGWLGFHPLVSLCTDRQRYGASVPDVLYPNVRPVVEVFTAGVTHTERELYPTPAAVPYPPPVLTYAAGWRGAHHALTLPDPLPEGKTADDYGILTDLPGLALLTELPPMMPGDVRSVIVELALIELDRRRQNLLGGKRNTVQIGDGTYRSEGYRAGAESEALNRLSIRHRVPRV